MFFRCLVLLWINIVDIAVIIKVATHGHLKIQNKKGILVPGMAVPGVQLLGRWRTNCEADLRVLAGRPYLYLYVLISITCVCLPCLELKTLLLLGWFLNRRPKRVDQLFQRANNDCYSFIRPDGVPSRILPTKEICRESVIVHLLY